MPIRVSIVIFIALLSWSTGCGVEIRAEATPSPVPVVITSTIPVTLTPQPSETPLPPPPQPMAPRATSVEGLTSTQVNVRAEPSTASNVLGLIPANTTVEITGKDPGESWWQVNYPQGQGVEGKGWVAAQYITTISTAEIPIIGGAQADPNNGNIAVIQQQINIRSGPGTSFNSLGTLNPQDIVSLTGKDPNGGWLQIEYASGPKGKGWVNAAFVQAQGVEKLPIITEDGQIVGTGTPTSIPPTMTATLVPAWEDNDSPASPVANVIFEPTGTQSLIYSGDLSSPQGDSEDWIAFQSYGPLVFASLECKGVGLLEVELTENAQPRSLDLACGGQMKRISVKAGANYLLHLRTPSATSNLQYTNYILTIKTEP